MDNEIRASYDAEHAQRVLEARYSPGTIYRKRFVLVGALNSLNRWYRKAAKAGNLTAMTIINKHTATLRLELDEVMQ
jgi:hypothetical protein